MADSEPRHPSWNTVQFPNDILAVPLNASFQPASRKSFDEVERSSSRFVFVAPQWCQLNPDLIDLLRAHIYSRPDVGIFYGDDAVVDADGNIARVCCKPVFNKALLHAKDYIGFPLIIRTSLLDVIQLSDLLGRAAWFEFVIGAVDLGICIERIPETLIATVGQRPEAGMEARKAVLSLAFAKRQVPLSVRPGRARNTLRVVREYKQYPEITLVIPTNQGRLPSDSVFRKLAGRPYIINFLDSLHKSSWPMDKINVLIGDNHQDDSIYRGRNDPFRVQRVVMPQPPGPFNLPRKINALWRASKTELMVLMNDDIVVNAPDWLESLFTFAMERDVGYVGARLLFADGKVQHAGMFGSIFGLCSHPWYLQPPDAPTYEDWAITQRDCSVTTGALFATRKRVMEAVGGFDERFSLDFNDVDCCLKMRMLGYRVVYAPDAELTHFEKATRRDDFAPGRQVESYLRRWQEFLNDDPMYSPQLTMDTSDVAPHPLAGSWLRRP